MGGVQGNLEDLKQILTRNQFVGIPIENIVTSYNESDSIIKDKLLQVAFEASETLFVYYVGHGDLYRGELYLTASNSKQKSLITTGIKISQFVEIIKESVSKRKIIILDCCYSGKVTEILSNQATIIKSEITGIKGTYVIASSPSNKPSRFIEGRRHTVFTGTILSIVRNGLNLPQKYIYLNQIYDLVKENLEKRNSSGEDIYPPVKSDKLNLSKVPFTKNIAFSFFEEKLHEGVVLLQKDQVEEALIVFREAIEVIPNYDKSIYIEQELKKFQEEVIDFEELKSQINLIIKTLNLQPVDFNSSKQFLPSYADNYTYNQKGEILPRSHFLIALIWIRFCEINFFASLLYFTFYTESSIYKLPENAVLRGILLVFILLLGIGFSISRGKKNDYNQIIGLIIVYISMIIFLFDFEKISMLIEHHLNVNLYPPLTMFILVNLNFLLLIYLSFSKRANDTLNSWKRNTSDAQQ